jgi:uncharacterized protein YkwD
MPLSRAAGVLGLALCTLSIAVPATALSPSTCEGAGAQATHSSPAAMARASLCLVNRERRKRGLRPLRSNRRLALAARRHAADMLRHGYFSHNSRSGASFVSRIKKTGYLRRARLWLVAENIAYGSGGGASPRAIVRAWMHSPPHRHSILDASFKELGSGVAVGASHHGKALYVQDFGLVRR